MNTYENELKEISKNWYSKIKENKTVEENLSKASYENAVQMALTTIFTKIKIAYGKTENYVRVLGADPNTKHFEDPAFIEAVQKVKDITKFKFYLYKAHKFAIDFWNYQNLYGVVAVAHENDLDEFKGDLKPFKITILKEL